MQTLTTIRPELLWLSLEQIRALGPWIWMVGGALAAMLAAVLFGRTSRVVPTISVLASAGAIWSCWKLFGQEELLFNRMLVMDRFTLFTTILFAGSALATTILSLRYLDRENLQHPEYYILTLFAAIGMMGMASALDLIVLFVALELMSISVYVLVGFRRADRRANEAAVKYFVLGGAASAIFLYGAALLFGATGSVNILDILSRVQEFSGSTSPLFTLGAALVIFGFLFKVASVPFHMWMPDVYEGAPTPVTGFMTTGVKVASFAAFVRVLWHLGYGHGLEQAVQRHLHDFLWWGAALTMLVGNVIALTQVNLKRMLAYSSIAHTGYLMVGLVSGQVSGPDAGPIYLYLMSYTVMNLAAFGVLSILGGRGVSGVNLHDLAGLAKRRPWMAFALAVFLFSMAGIPPTAGFAAKYLLLASAVQSGEVLLTVIAVLCSAVSVYYYLRVLVYMYMREPAASRVENDGFGAAGVAVMATVVLTLQIGLFPGPVMEAAKQLTVARVASTGGR